MSPHGLVSAAIFLSVLASFPDETRSESHVTDSACLATCKKALLSFSEKHVEGFIVGRNMALKRVTRLFPRIRDEVLRRVSAGDKVEKDHLWPSLVRPMCVDVGAAAYGPPDGVDGSDGLLLVKVFGAEQVPIDVHAFEMQRDMAETLQKEFASMRPPTNSTFTVHNLGMGERNTTLPVVAPVLKKRGTKKRTYSLYDPETHSQAPPCGAPQGAPTATKPCDSLNARVSVNTKLMVNVTTFDAFASTHAPPETAPPVFYVKIDTEGHEPQVFRGMHATLKVRPPLYISFEYGDGWSAEMAQLRSTPTGLANGQTHFPRSVLGTSDFNLRDVTKYLTDFNYAVYLLHTNGLIRIDGPWWDEFYELVLYANKTRSHTWHDVIAAQKGVPQAALVNVINEQPFPCLVTSTVTQQDCPRTLLRKKSFMQLLNDGSDSACINCR